MSYKVILSIVMGCILFANLGMVHGQTSIILNTDKPTYQPGDLVTITGKAPGPNYPISIEMRDSSDTTRLIRNPTSDANGNFELQFKIPSDITNGTMKLIATTPVNGKTISNTLDIAVSNTVPATETPVNPKGGGGCLIATAAFGTELAPQLQLLRETRDDKLMHTSSGSSFMTSFDKFYYTFSPTVADWERQNPAFRETVRLAITPMISTLSILNYVDINSDQEMVAYGVAVILLNIGIYAGLPLGSVFFVKHQLDKK